MKIVMVSNFLNHHQLPLCSAFLRRGVEFSFIATMGLAEQRAKMGYADLNHSCSFVVNAYESPREMERALSLCSACDIMILGGRLPAFRRRAKPGCVVFVYSERLFKASALSRVNILRYCKYFPAWFYSRGAYLLCSGAYAARDYGLLGQYRNRAYKWGYFPEVKPQDAEAILAAKEPASIIWVGRFLSWKHPEIAVDMAERLKRDGIPFSLSMIGDGEMRKELEARVESKGLTSFVRFPGFIPPEEVRRRMERSVVHLFTSDRGEGWGAVLNESMNSCCIVIANNEIGSVPYLIQDGVNGFLYDGRDEDGLYRRLAAILKDPGSCRSAALAANETMQNVWNAETAAVRLIELASALSRGEDTPFETGPCSRA